MIQWKFVLKHKYKLAQVIIRLAYIVTDSTFIRVKVNSSSEFL